MKGEKMENLNAEMIKKAWECCNVINGCKDCPYSHNGKPTDNGECSEKVSLDVLALIKSQEQKIKELTEENERLKAEKETLEIYNADYKFKNKELTAFNRRWAKECADLQDECEQIKENTVRKIQERLKRRFKVDRDSIYTGYNIHRYIDQIAKEMLEGIEK